MKKSSYQKLKYEIQELKKENKNLTKDLYFILDGDELLKIQYLTKRTLFNQINEALWIGETTTDKEFTGIFKQLNK